MKIIIKEIDLEDLENALYNLACNQSYLFTAQDKKKDQMGKSLIDELKKIDEAKNTEKGEK